MPALIPLTKDRLEEARFFPAHLQHERKKHAHPNKPPSSHLRYYLHAFVSAARSVPIVLKKEGKEYYIKREGKKKYHTWDPSSEAQISVAEKQLSDLMIEKRNRVAHEGPIETTTRSEEVEIPIEPNPYQPYTHRAYLLQLRRGGGPWTIREDHFVELDGREQEITTVCERYFDFLETLVNIFVKTYSDADRIAG
jgi:hypothetical protein